MGLGTIISAGNLPTDLIGGASQVEVYERLGDTTLYSIRFPDDIVNDDFPQLVNKKLDPGAVIAITVPINNKPECLVKGPVHSQQIQMLHGGQGTGLEVRGADSSIRLDREFNSSVWSNVTDSEAVIAIVSQYGLIPDVRGTNTRHLETKHSLIQRDTDLQFIRRLARRNGYLFWITCNVLVETAHFKRLSLSEQPKVDLIINRENNNISAFEIFWDVERPTSVEGSQLDLTNKSAIDGKVRESPQKSLGAKSLKKITNDVRSTHVAAPGDDAGNLQARGEGVLIDTQWFIKARCQTSVKQLGKLVRAHMIVNVIGAGSRHSGKYLVSGVKHLIDATGHLMEIELIRNGWE